MKLLSYEELDNDAKRFIQPLIEKGESIIKCGIDPDYPKYPIVITNSKILKTTYTGVRAYTFNNITAIEIFSKHYPSQGITTVEIDVCHRGLIGVDDRGARYFVESNWSGASQPILLYPVTGNADPFVGIDPIGYFDVPKEQNELYSWILTLETAAPHVHITDLRKKS